MKREILNIICCPNCYSSFELSTADSDGNKIASGKLVCPKCDVDYPIIDGLPVIVKDTGKMATTQRAFGNQWLWQNNGYFEDDTIYGGTEKDELNDFKIGLGISNKTNLSEKVILDAGCGSGRLTKNVATMAKDAKIIGIDMSNAAEVANARSHDIDNMHIIQCNILSPPFRPNTFDYIWSKGVIHHTPSTSRSFSKLDNLLAKKGTIYIWVYALHKFNPYALARKLLWRPYVLPPQVRYFLSWLFAIPLFFCSIAIRQRRELRNIVFCLYDSFAPEFAHRHSKKEVMDWFFSHKYKEVNLIRDDVGVQGKK